MVPVFFFRGAADAFGVSCELKKMDFYQGRYSSADWFADLDSTVPDRGQYSARQIASSSSRDQCGWCVIQFSQSIQFCQVVILVLFKDRDWLV